MLLSLTLSLLAELNMKMLPAPGGVNLPVASQMVRLAAHGDALLAPTPQGSREGELWGTWGVSMLRAFQAIVLDRDSKYSWWEGASECFVVLAQVGRVCPVGSV